ncbi:MAG: ribokinase [Planctomycetota bacterium]
MTGRIPKIVVIGGTYVDMAVRCEQMPQPGETVIGSGFSCTPMGPGVNQAVQAALCGCDVHLISKAGNDLFAQMIKQTLSQFKINTDLVGSAEAKSTGIIVTIVNSKGENRSCISPGANRALTAEDITSEKAENIIASADLCLIHGELPRQAVSAAINMANLHKTTVILDPAGALEQPSPQEADLPVAYFSANILIPDINKASEIADEPVASIHTAKLLGSDFIARGVDCAVIRIPRRGCIIVDRNGTEQIPAFETDLVDETAARDAFAGALAASCAVGDNIREAARFACAAQALACSKFGTIDALPKKEEIIQLLQGSAG